MRNPKAKSKSTQKRRLPPSQNATATAAGVSAKDVEEMSHDDGTVIVVAEIGKSKGGNVAGYMAQLHNEEGHIIDCLPTLYPKPTPCAHAARKAWPSNTVDEGKALTAFFSAFTGRWNDFIGLKGDKREDEAEVLKLLNDLYPEDEASDTILRKADKADKAEPVEVAEA